MIPGRITIEPAYEDDPPGGECFAVYVSRDGSRRYALGRCRNEWHDGPATPFPNTKAAHAAIHCIPIPEDLQ
jgi:hypothetical protein